MLTGKDVHEATLFATSDSAGSQWDKLNTFDKQVYEVAASVLNGYHIAPLQQQVDGLEQQVSKLKSDIKELRDMDRKIFDEQEKQLTDLKALVKEYHEFNKYDAPQLRANYQRWDAGRNALQARAQALLQEKEN